MIEQINNAAQTWLQWMWPMFWQVALLVGLIALINLAIRKKVWPQIRYALWLLVLVKLVLPPSLALPTSVTSHLGPTVGKFLWPGYSDIQMNSAEPAEPDVMPALPHSDQAMVQFAPAISAESMGVPMKTAVAQPGMGLEAPTVVPHREGPELCWQAYALFAWLAGVVLLAGWLGMRLRQLRKAHHATGVVVPQRMKQLLADTAKKLRLRRLPKIVLSPSVASPAVFGVFRPVLLLPAKDIQQLSRADIEHIFLHELAHIKRGDLVVHAVNMVLQVVYWFNPLLWVVRRQLQHLRELCCDASVGWILREKTSDYSQTILETARRLLAKPIGPGMGLLGLFEDANSLAARLKWLEKKSWQHRTLRIITGFVVVALMCACVLPMAKGKEKAGQEDVASEPKFTVTLSNGATVELVGLCNHPNKALQWWRADGSLLDRKISTKRKGQVSSAGKPYEIVINIVGPDDLSFRWDRIDGAHGTAGRTVVDDAGKEIKGMYAKQINIDEGRQTTFIRIGAATGPWETFASSEGRGVCCSGRSGHGVTFGEAYEKDGKVKISVSDDLFNSNYAVIAIDKNGKEHSTKNFSSGSAGKVRQTTFTFHNLKLSDISQFQFRTRPYEWLEFRNVSLVPGKKTDVQVVVEPTQPAMQPARQRHFVRLVLGKDSMTFQGEQVSWDELPLLLEKVADREQTVLEVAIASEDVSAKRLMDAMALAKPFGFEYSSYIGSHPLGSKGTEAQTVAGKKTDVQVVTDSGDEQFDEFVRRLKEAANDDARWLAAMGLERTGRADAIPHLTEALKQVDFSHPSAAKRIVRNIRNLESKNSLAPENVFDGMYSQVLRTLDSDPTSRHLYAYDLGKADTIYIDRPEQIEESRENRIRAFIAEANSRADLAVVLAPKKRLYALRGTRLAPLKIKLELPNVSWTDVVEKAYHQSELKQLVIRYPQLRNKKLAGPAPSTQIHPFEPGDLFAVLLRSGQMAVLQTKRITHQPEGIQLAVYYLDPLLALCRNTGVSSLITLSTPSEIQPATQPEVTQESGNFVYITGDVSRPGAYTWNSELDLTVLRMLAGAGFDSRKAGSYRVMISHLTDSSFDSKQLDIQAIFDGKEPDVELQPGYILTVTELASQPATHEVDWVSRISKPYKSKRFEHMRTILKAIVMYRTDYRGDWPAELSKINPYLPREMIVSPDQYIYKFPGKVLSVEGKRPVLFEKAAVRPDGEFVGFDDTHVEFVKDRQRLNALKVQTGLQATQPAMPAAGKDTALGVAAAFLDAVKRDQVEKALGLTLPGSGTAKGLTKLRELFDLSQARIVEVFVGRTGACAVSSFFPTKEGDRSIAIGIALTKRDTPRWLVRDLDRLLDEKNISRYIENFLKHVPDARRFIADRSVPLAVRPKADVLDAEVGPVFKIKLQDNATLNLDSGNAASRKPLWPEGFELAWDGLDAELSIKSDSSVRMLLLPEAKSFAEAVGKSRQNLEELKVSKKVSMRGLEAKYLAVLTSEARLAVVQVIRLTGSYAELAWAKEKIASSAERTQPATQAAHMPAQSVPAFAVFTTGSEPTFIDSLADILAGKNKEFSVVKLESIEDLIESQAEVLVLYMQRYHPLESFAKTKPAILEALKSKKVIGIGYGAAQLFRELGLEIGAGSSAHFTSESPRIVIQSNGLVDKAKFKESFVAYNFPAAKEDLYLNAAMFLPRKSPMALVVEPLARCDSRDFPGIANYAPVVRQGNYIMIGLATPPKTWTSTYQEFFQLMATALKTRKLQPFSLAQWEITKPETYKFQLAKSRSTEELSGKSFYFRFTRPVRFLARLDHTGTNNTMLHFMGEKNQEHKTRRDARHGEPLQLSIDITQKDVERMEPRYWRLKVTNFDREHTAACSLTIEYDPKAIPQPAENLTFGPVIERVIPSAPTDGKEWLIDFDAGKVISIAPDEFAKQVPKIEGVNAYLAWYRQTGMDAVVRVEEPFHGLVGIQLVVVPAKDADGLNLKADALVNSVSGLKPGTGSSLRGGTPLVYKFKTREGGMGILQITGFTENPKGVKIRYKMVQTPTGRTGHEALVSRAEAFVDMLAAGEFAKARSSFDGTMSQAMSTEKLEGLWKQLEQVGGQYLDRSQSRVEKVGQYAAVFVPCQWQRNRLDLKVVFDKAGHIIGFWTMAPQRNLPSPNLP